MKGCLLHVLNGGDHCQGGVNLVKKGVGPLG